MKAQRFIVLDGLRGVAALVVLTFHLVQQHTLTALPLAGLAVDFFYILSGFVVASAYEARLQNGTMCFTAFARTRMTRLYPLIFLGTSAGIILGFFAASHGDRISFQEVALGGALGLLLLPSYVFPQWATAYPFNMASWSLTFELLINGAYALVIRYLSLGRLIVLAVCSAVILVWIGLVNHGISGGNNQSNFLYGFGRVRFPFFVGVLLFRVRPRQREAPWLGPLLIVSLAAIFLWPVNDTEFSSLVCVLLLFPMIVFAGAAVTAGTILSKVCRFGGEISYPIYILQGPFLRVGEEVLKHWHSSSIGYWIFSIAEGAFIGGIALAALKFYDRPLQDRLGSAFRRDPPASRDAPRQA